MACGLYVMQDGAVMVAYGQRRISISRAEYKANGYSPALEKLVLKLPVAHKRKVFAEVDRGSSGRPNP